MMSSVGSASTSASTRNRSPFTAAQWQELEHQALIFKYMISGMPIPPELIYSVKRSLDSSTSSRFFSTQHPVGWGCFDMSFGRKVDPEPGRCRRTDGKKWRCSKEAYPDSKYCEKHMHRGRHRSRKPVEVAATTTPTATTNNTTANTTITSPSISSMNRNISLSNNPDTSTPAFSFSPLSSYPYPCQNPFLAAHSTYSRTSGSDFSHQNNVNTIPHLFLDSSSYSPAGKEYSRDHGIKGVDELAFFPEASGTSTSYAESYNQHLTMSSYNKGYSSQSHHHSATVSYDNQSPQEQQHCFVLGTDFKSQRADKSVKEAVVGDTQKPLHHFFGEWPPKDTDSWLDLASSTSRIPHDD